MRASSTRSLVGAALGAGALLFLGLGGAQEARAETPCDAWGDGMATGPVAAGLLEGELGRPHRVCGRSEVGVAGGGLLLVELENFFGRLSAGLGVDASWAARPDLEVFGEFEMLHYELLLSPLASNQLSWGHTNLGLSWRFFERTALALALQGKVVLPTAIPLYKNAHPFGFDFGLGLQVQAHKRVHFHGNLGMLHSFAVGAGPSQPQTGLSVLGGVELRPGDPFAFVADIYASFGYTDAVDVLATALAVRFSDSRRFGFELGFTIPLAGRERAAVRLDARWMVRLGPVPVAP